MWAACPASGLLSGCSSSQQHKANSSVNLRKNPFLCFPCRSVQYPSYNDCKNSEVSSSESIGGSIEFRFCNSRHHTKVSCARLWLQISAPCFNKATTDLTTVSKCCPCWLAWSVIPCTQVACFEIVSLSGNSIKTETFSSAVFRTYSVTFHLHTVTLYVCHSRDVGSAFLAWTLLHVTKRSFSKACFIII